MRSGNFLVIAYKRLRELEIQLLNDLMDAGVNQIDLFSQITLENFYGIEYADFAAETAKVSLRIAEQQMDAIYGEQFNKPASILPLREAPNIVCKSALSSFEGDEHHSWVDVCPVPHNSEIYVVGNPPYLGARNRNKLQDEEQAHIMKGRINNSPMQLDYVCNWFVYAFDFCNRRPNSKFAFVSTNSITQGMHVPALWPHLLSGNMEIDFAYPSFKWSNMAGRSAGVTCIIVGMRHKSDKPKRLFLPDGELTPWNINPYLMPSANAWVYKRDSSVSVQLPLMSFGNMPLDGGHLHLTEDEKQNFIFHNPESKRFIRRLLGSQELLKGYVRYCLWISDDDLDLALSIKPIRERVESVKVMRENSKVTGDAFKHKNTPHKFRGGPQSSESKSRTIVVPSVSSGERKYLPVITCEDGEIINNSAFMVPNAEPWHMAILSSTLHRCWLGAVAGKLKGDYRYSNSLVWNTFPMPELSDDDKDVLNKTAQKILNARHYHPDLTLGDMYNKANMGPQLLAAHKENDKVLESIFRDKPFKNDEERLAHLFERYAEMTQGNK